MAYDPIDQMLTREALDRQALDKAQEAPSRTSTRTSTSTSSGSSSSSGGSSQYGTAYTPSKGSLSAQQIAQYAYNAGFRGQALTDAVAIALAESRGNPGAHNPNGEDSRGLWQINVDPNTSWGRKRLEQYGNLYDPAINAKAAFEISGQGKNFGPWTTYAGTSAAGRHNPHTQFLGDAAKAAAQVTGVKTLPGYQGGTLPGYPTSFSLTGGGDMEGGQPFFDPTMAELIRRTALDTEFGVLGLEQQNRRLVNDFNLLVGTPEAPGRVRRQFDAEARRTADSTAGRGFHGQNSGIMRGTMGRLAEDQTESLGMLNQQFTRGREDIAREIANLEARAAIGGSEATRGGASNATDRVLRRLPF